MTITQKNNIVIPLPEDVELINMIESYRDEKNRRQEVRKEGEKQETKEILSYLRSIYGFKHNHIRRH